MRYKRCNQWPLKNKKDRVPDKKSKPHPNYLLIKKPTIQGVYGIEFE